MRIGFYAGSLSGSGKTTVTPLAKGLARKGHDVYVMGTKRFPPQSTRIEDNITYQRESTISAIISTPASIGLKTIQRVLDGERTEGVLRPYDGVMGECIANFVETNDLDVIYLFHNHVVGPYLPERVKRTKLVINLIGFGIDQKRGGERNTFAYQDYVFTHPVWNAHVAATSFEYSQYKSVYRKLGLDTDRLFYLPHSVDTHLFNNDVSGDLESLGLTDAGLVITYPVQVYPRKNIELGIRVLSELASVNTRASPTFVISGSIVDQDYHKQLCSLASELGVRDSVRFLDWIPRENMPELLAGSDLVLFPSHQETFGIGIVEALACGTPVVGPGYIHATREVLESVSGGYAAEKSVESFRDNVLQAMESSFSQKEISQQALSKYGNDTVAARFEALIQSNVVRNSPTVTPDPEEVAFIEWAELYEDEQAYNVADRDNSI